MKWRYKYVIWSSTNNQSKRALHNENKRLTIYQIAISNYKEHKTYQNKGRIYDANTIYCWHKYHIHVVECPAYLGQVICINLVVCSYELWRMSNCKMYNYEYTQRDVFVAYKLQINHNTTRVELCTTWDLVIILTRFCHNSNSLSVIKCIFLT